MRVKLVKPVPQIGRVIPAGVIIDDAPESFKKRLIREGKAILFPPTAAETAREAEAMKPKQSKPRRKE